MSARAVELSAGDYQLTLEPARGGSIARFTWRGINLMRPARGTSILDTACFPLVPFSNRIAYGHAMVDGQALRLPPNFPGSDHPHPLHGFGWLARWDVILAEKDWALLRHRHEADSWPWRYEAEQDIVLSETGLSHGIRLRNLATTAMPAGIGLHPYFPLTAETRYRGLHRGEWQTAEDGLPIRHEQRAAAEDWWSGEPVATRAVDTVYTHRRGPIEIIWPERECQLAVQPSDALSCTVLYTPAGQDFFCVEPVSHDTDAINGNGIEPMRRLQPGELMKVHVQYHASLWPSAGILVA